MKKILILMVSALLSFNACAKNAKEENAGTNSNVNGNIVAATQNSQQGSSSNREAGKKVLVVYFSLPEQDDRKTTNNEEDDSSVTINGKTMGNTEYLANLIQERTCGDVFRIETKKVYPINDHKRLVDMATEERKSNFRPELKQNIQNLDQYDTIFLGYPIWWADMPMALYTFLENTDLSGKKVILFNTHGGSGLVNTVNTIKELQPKADINGNVISIYRGEAENAKNQVDSWLNDLNY